MDGLIDGIITITIDNPSWVELANNEDSLIIHSIFRPRQSDEPLKKDDSLSLRKILGEGKLAERNELISLLPVQDVRY